MARGMQTCLINSNRFRLLRACGAAMDWAEGRRRPRCTRRRLISSSIKRRTAIPMMRKRCTIPAMRIPPARRAPEPLRRRRPPPSSLPKLFITRPTSWMLPARKKKLFEDWIKWNSSIIIRMYTAVATAAKRLPPHPHRLFRHIHRFSWPNSNCCASRPSSEETGLKFSSENRWRICKFLFFFFFLIEFWQRLSKKSTWRNIQSFILRHVGNHFFYIRVTQFSPSPYLFTPERRETNSLVLRKGFVYSFRSWYV